MKKIYLLIPPLLISSTLLALPEGSEVAAGQAEFHSPDAKSLHIRTSDKAIINYRKFNIKEGELVQFIQPTSKSAVLNRIKGGDPSRILGNLSGNGRVFLVNPNGIYFGPNSTVNTGSFLASTLNIRDEDFMNDKLLFFMEPGSEKASIVSEGTISAGQEGFIAFFAPFIENRGSVLARAGKVILASAERVTLDFTGDGLIQFTVDGDLKQSLIENYGKIQAASGAVEISLRTARDAIKMVVNTDGITPANAIEEINGVIRLISKSSIIADKVLIDGTKVEARGSIDASSSALGKKGGEVQVLGENIELIGAKIDVSGDFGGGSVLIGGDYQGKGEVRTAQNTIMDNTSLIHADAYREGDGGKVILWADDTTLFDGKIYAKGGLEGGNGGFVETSGKMELGVLEGAVDTSAPLGAFGMWLLDPATVTIQTAGADAYSLVSPPNCATNGNRTIDPVNFQNLASNATICAQRNTSSSITINSPIAMTVSGVGLTLTAGSTSTGTITINTPSITTTGGDLNFSGNVVIAAGVSSSINTAAGAGANGNIAFSGTINGTSGGAVETLTLNAGTKSITATGGIFGAGGVANATGLTTVAITNSGALNFTGPIAITGALTQTNAATGATTFGNTVAVGSAVLRGTTFAINNSFTAAAAGAVNITNSGAITKSATGSIVAPAGFTTSGDLNLSSNITTAAGAINIGGILALGANVALDTTNSGGAPAGANITASSNITGASNTLSVNGGTGGVVSIGGNLNVSSFTVANSASTTITGLATVPTVVLTNSVGNITFNGAATIATALTTAAQGYGVVFNNGGTITPATTFLNTGNLSLFSGSSANLTFTNGLTHTAGSTTMLGSIKVATAAAAASLGPVTFNAGSSTVATNGGSFSAGAGTITGTATIDTTNAGGSPAGANITFSSTLNGAGNLTLTSGTAGVASFGAVGAVTPLSSLTATGATINQNSTAKTTGAINYTGSSAINLGGNLTTAGGIATLTGPLFLSADVTIDTTNSGGTPAGANISIPGPVNNARNFTLNAGTGGTVSFGTVGATTPLTTLTATGSIISQNSSVKTTGAVGYTGSSAINLGGNVTTAGGIIGLTGPSALTTNVALDTTNSGGAPAGANITASSNITGASNTLSVNGGTGGVVSIGGNLNVSSFTVANSASTTITGLATVPTVVLTNSVGNITFNGAATIATALTTAAQGYGVVFNNGGSITGSTSLINTGGVTLKSGSSPSLIFTGGLASTASLTTVLGTVKTSVAAAPMSLGSVVFSSGNSVLSTSGGSVGFASTVTLSGNATVDTTNSGAVPAGAGITMNGAVNGPGNLTLVAGTGGGISLVGAVGGGPQIGVLTIGSAGNVTANAITASSIVQSAGTGTTTFNGVVNTSGTSGISLTGTNFAINANVTTTNTGPLTINHTGSLVISPGVTLSIDGIFTDNGSGSGSTNLVGTISTNGQNITFSNPVTLVGTASLNTGAGVGNILFSSTLDGTQNLTLSTGLGNINFIGAVGTTRLGTLTINTVNNVDANALSATVYNQLAGSGTSTFNGAVNISGVSGFSLIGTNAAFNNSVTTASGGPVNLQIANTLALSSSAPFNLDGPFTQSGAGSVQARGSITTTNDTIQFAGPVALSGAMVLNTGAGIGDIVFSSTLDGPGALTMTAGTGNITLSSAAGSLTRLGAITINNATNVSTQAITAASIKQAVAALGTSTFSGNLNTNAIAGIQLNSPILNVSGNLVTTNAGPVSLAHAGLLTLNAGAGSTIASTFTESGSGGVNLFGTILTNNASISFANAVSLTGTTSLNSGPGAGSINFASSIDGGQNLTLTSGVGDLVIGGNVGSGVRLNNLIINQAANVTAGSISAATLTQLNGSGTTTLNGPINTNALGGVSLTGTAFTVNNTITTTSLGPVAISNAGTLNLTSGATCSIAGGFTQLNAGGVTLSDQLTAGGAISFAGPITLSGNALLSTAAASQNITLANTVNGGGNLTLAAGGGNIAFQSAVGGISRIGTLTISSALDVSTLGITAGSINQLAGGGTTTVSGDLDTNTASGMTFILNNFTRSGGLATTGGGPVTVTNSGTLTSMSTGVRTIDGFYLQNGTGPVIYSGTIETNNQPISFSSPITLNGDVTLNSGAAGGNISLLGTVNGAHILNLIAGTGDILLSGIIGGAAPLTSLTLTSAHNVTAQNAITAQRITQTAATGTSIFNGALSASTSAGIVLTGAGFQFNNTVTTTSAGAFTLSNSGTALFAANFSIDGVFSQSGAGGVSLAASLSTTGNNLTISSPITLIGNSSLSSGGIGSGNVTVSSTVNGAHTLTLTGGTGDVIVFGAIGATSPLSQLTATGNNITLANIGTGSAAGVSGPTNLTATANLNFTGSNYNAAAQTYSALAANVINVPLTTFTASGANVSFASAPIVLGTNANLAINSGNGAINLNAIDAASGSLRTVTLNSGTGPVTVGDVGTLGNSEIASLNVTGGNLFLHGNIFSNAVTFSTSGAHTIFLGGNITTVGSPILFPVDVVRDTVNNATLTSSGGTITFQGKVDGDVALTRSLTIAAGNGDTLFSGALGSTAALNVLGITSARNVTTAAVTAGSITQSAGTGTTSFGGQVTTSTSSGLILTGNNFSFSSGVDTTANSGLIQIFNSGTLTINSGTIWNLGGDFSQTGAGPNQLAVHIDGNNGIAFASPVTLIGTTVLDTAAANKTIHLASTVDGGFDLTMDAGTSNVIVEGAIGSISRLGSLIVTSAANITTQSISAASINFTWGSGTFAFTGALNTNALSGIVLTGTNVFSTLGSITTSNGGPLFVTTSGTTSGTSSGPTVVSGSITQSSTGTGFIGGTFISLTGNITTAHNIQLVAPLTVDTSASGGDIIVQGTVNGSFPITFKAGTGNINLQQAVGAATPLGAFVVNNASNLTTQAVNAASITQLTGTGTSTFNGPLSTTSSGGISIATHSIVRGAAVTTANAGPCTFAISNSGTLTSTAAGTITSSGAFTQSGTGAVAFGGTLNVANNNISFAGPIALSSDAVLNSGSGLGNTTLSSAVQGSHALTIVGGAGSISLNGALGTALVPLTSLTLQSALNITAQSIHAGQILQQTGTGTTTFNGALSTNALGGISLAGTGFAFNASFTTTNLGPFTLTNSGLATMSAAATGSVDANFLQNGLGTTQLSSAISSTTGGIQFSGPVTLSGTSSLTTFNQPITLLSTLDSTASTPGSLTVSSGNGAFTIQGAAGASHPINVLTISNAGNVTAQSIAASSITQSAGSGTTLLNGDLSASGAGGIHLSGTNFTLSGNASTIGSIAINNSGVLTTGSGKTLSGNAGFSEMGAVSVNLGSNVTTVNNPISFTSPMTLISNVVLNSGTSAGDITLDTVDGNFDLTFTPGRDIFAGMIGGAARLGTVKVTTVRDVHASSIIAAAIIQLAGSGTNFLNGNINTNTPTGINLVGTNFTRNGSIITTNGGSFAVTHTGLITGTSINTTSIDGSYTATGVGVAAAHNIAGTITARLGISISSPITLLSDPLNLTPIIFDTSGGNGNINLISTVNNDVNAPHKFILRSGSGNTTLSAAVGQTAPIGMLVFGNVNNVSAAAINADSIQQEIATTIAGTATFNGAIATTGASGIALTAVNTAFNQNVSSSGGGPVALSVSNSLNLANGIALSLDGPFTQTGNGTVTLGSAITTTNDNISFASAVTLTGNTSLNTGAGIGDITFSSLVDGAFPLLLAAGTGNVSLLGSVGQTNPLTGVTLSSANNFTANANITTAGPIAMTTAGTITLSGSVTTTTLGGTIALTNGGTLTISSPILASSSLTQSQIGSPNISLNANLTSTGNLQLASNTTLTSSVVLNSNGGNLNLLGTVNSDATARNLTLASGSGNITLSSAIGGVNPLAGFQIQSSANVTAANISAASIQQTAGSGLTHFTGTLTTTALQGVTLTGAQFTLDDVVTTTGGGPLTIAHSGTLTLNTLPAMGSHSLSGPFFESGGPVSTGANMTLTNQLITFSDAVTLTGNTVLTSGGGNIKFSSSIDGPFCLTLTAGTGTIELDGPIGTSVNLGCLTASGSSIFQNNSILTTGAVQETGAIQLGGNITTAASNITLSGNVTLTTTNTTLSTGGGAGGGTIHITGTINPNLAGSNFTSQTGSAGTVIFDSSVGGVAQLNNFTVSSGTIDINNFGSGSQGATGTLALTAASDINFTGSTYNNGTQNYTAGGNFNFNAGVPTAITSNSLPVTFATGTMELSPGTDLSITTSGGNVTLTDLFGNNRTLDVNAALGNVTVAHIGTMGMPLNAINVTAAFLTAPFTTFPPITFTPTTATLIGVNQIDPSNYFSPVIITADNILFSFSSCPGGNNIVFNSTLDSDAVGNARNIVFDMCGNTLTFKQAVGSTAPLSSITVNDDSGLVVDSSMSVGAFTQTTTRPGATTVFADGLTTVTSAAPLPTSGNVSMTTANITLNGSYDIAGAMTLVNTGTLNAPGVICNIAGGSFSQTGTGSVNVSGNIQTSDNAIAFHGPATLNGALILKTVNSSGGNIIFDSTIGGNFDLTMTAGSGDITLSNDLGAPLNRLSNVSFISCHNLSTKSIYSSAITQSAGSGLLSFVGTIDTSGVNGINLTGTDFSFSGALNTSSGGNLVITNSGTITGVAGTTATLDGAFIQNGSISSIVNAGGTITAKTGISFVGPISVVGSTVFDTSGGSGNIVLNNTVNGANNLTLKAGGGNVSLVSPVGAITPLAALILSDLNNFTSSTISSGSITQAPLSSITGQLSFNGALSTTGASGIVLAAPRFALNNNITTTGGGPLTLTNTSTLAFANAVTISLTGPFLQNGGGAVHLAGSLSAMNQNITFTDGVTLTGSTVLSSGTGVGAGNILFSSTLDGTQSLDLTAGMGSIAFTGSIGSVAEIGAFTVVSANGITYPSIKAVSLHQLANAGATTINGPLLTTGSAGISLKGAAFTQNAAINTLGTGAFAIEHTGLFTMAVGSSTSAAGGYTDSLLSTGPIFMRGSITTPGSLSFSGSGAITLSADTTLTSGISNGGITINGTIDGANNLTLNSGTDFILLSADVGSMTRIGALTINSTGNVDVQKITASSVAQAAGLGTTTFHDSVDVNGINGVSLIGSAFTFDNTVTSSGGPVVITNAGLALFGPAANVSSTGDFILNGTGPIHLANAITTTNGEIHCFTDITLTANSSLNSSAGNKLIMLHGSIDGAHNFSLTSGSGNIDVLKNIGSVSRLGSLSLSSSGMLTLQAINAASITQTGTAAATYSGTLNTNTGSGISLTGSAITLSGNATATSGGPIAIVNSGPFSTAVGATFSGDGGFSQLGAGAVTISGNIQTKDNAITIHAPVTLNGDLSLSSINSAGANITFDNVVTGSFDLTFAAGSGDITLSNDLGTLLSRLRNVSFISSHNLSTKSMFASLISQAAGSGLLSFVGTIDTNTLGGIHLTGTDFSFSGALHTSNRGDLVITNSGTIAGIAGTTATLDGAFIQNGSITSTVFAGGTITAREGISFVGPISVAGDTFFDTSSGNGNITLSSTVDNFDLITPHSLTINAGVGSVALSSAVGSSKPLNNLKITGSIVSLGNVGTLGTSGLAGVLQIPDPLGTITPNQVVFTGTTINALTQSYTATTSFNMNAGALTTFKTSSNPISFATGAIQLAANTDLTVNSVSGMNGGNITTADIHAGAGSLRHLILNAGTGIAMPGTVQPGAIGLAGSGQFASVSLTGILNLQGSIAANAISFTPTGSMTVGGNLATVGTSLTFPTAVVLTASRTFSTGGGNILFSDTLDADVNDTRNLTLAAGAGDITFSNAVGSAFRPNILTIASARNVTATAAGASINVGAILQASGTGTTEFARNVSTRTSVGVAFTGANLQFDSTSTLNTTNNGPLTVANLGTFTFDGNATLSGGLTQTGSGSSSLAGSISAGQPVSFARPVVIAAATSIDTSLNGQSIIFSDTLNGPGNLTLTAGNGNISLQKTAGGITPLGAVTVVSAHDIGIVAFTATSLNQMAGSGTSSISGTLTTSGPAGITLVGANFLRNGAIITTGGGSITVTNSGLVTGSSINTTSISGSYIQNGTGPFHLAGTITAGANISFTSPITLLGPAGFDTTSGGGSITFANTATVDGFQPMTFSAGSGSIAFNAPLGTTNRVGAIAIHSAANVNTQAINAASISQINGTGTTTLSGDINTNGTAGIVLSGNNFVRGSNWTTTNNGPISITIPPLGSFTSIAAGTINAAGGFQQLGAGAVSLSQTVNTSSAPILFSGPVALAGTTTLNTGSSNVGNITFNSSLDGAADLFLSSGAGDILVQGAVGSGVRLGTLTINNANDVTFHALKATAITQLTGDGTTTLNGPTDINSMAGIDITTSNVTLNGSLTTTNNGPVAIENTGLLTVSGTCFVASDFIQDGTGPSLLSGSVTSASGQIAFAGAVSTTGTPQLTTFAQPILFSSTLDGPAIGSGNLTLDAGALGDITFIGQIGSINRLGDLLVLNARNVTMGAITAGSITQSMGSGTTSILGTVNTNSLSGIALSGNAFTINGSVITTNNGPMNIIHSGLLTFIGGPSTLISGFFTENGTGTVSMSGLLHTNEADITLNTPVTLLTPTTINSDGTGDILIFNTVDGATDLTLVAGANDINVTAAIGGTTPLNSLTIESALNASFVSIHANKIAQLGGTGLTTFNGALTTTTFDGIDIAGAAFTFNAPVTTTGNGKVNIDNAGVLTLNSGAVMNLTGPFSQVGAGQVLLSASISIDNDAMLFNGPVSLGNTVSLSTATAAGDITFVNTIDGFQNLNLNAGIGAITFSRAIGSSTPLNALTITSASDLTTHAISATSINASSVFHSTTFNGPLTTTGASGIVLSGGGFAFLDNVTTSNNGPLSITNSGTVSLSPFHTVSLAGVFNQMGTGLVQAAGSLLTNNQTASFASPVFLIGDYAINTGPAGADVTFNSDFDGPFNMTIEAGIGNVVFQKAIGDGGPINNFTIASAHDISLTGVGTATAGVSGTLSLTASHLINLDNIYYTAGTQLYSAGTSIHFINGAQTNLTTLGGPVSFSGGSVLLSDKNDLFIITNNGSFSYLSLSDLSATNFENVNVNTGTGTALMNTVSGTHINNLFVHAGLIEIVGPMNAINTDFESLGRIENLSLPQLINSKNTAIFNALNGDVGILASPIFVNTQNQIFAGAGGRQDSLADFNGSSVDNTVHSIPSNPPCKIIFNNVVIKDCNAIPISPVVQPKKVPTFPFAVPGFDSSFFNLASDYFFLPYFLDDTYVRKEVAIYYRTPSTHKK